MQSFHGSGKRQSYFEGWYFKQQNQSDTVAFIPAFHINDQGHPCASLQIITDKEVYHVQFPARIFLADREKLRIRVGDCIFTEHGCKLKLNTKDVSIHGVLHYGPPSPPAYDIMGPFRFIPFMECRHSLFSMYHKVNGILSINGRKILFQNGTGYIEGDRGVSFPSRYIWTQCNWNGNCIMLSIADIPFCGRQFTGCIGILYLNKKEYRVATYLGVNLLYVTGNTICLRQGRLTLFVILLDRNFRILRAPKNGNMIRGIHESAACRVHYILADQNKVVFDFVSDQASYENNW